MAFVINDSATLSGTTTATSVHLNSAPIGAMFIVTVQTNATSGTRVVSITDSGGNPYVQFPGFPFNGTGQQTDCWYALNGNTLGNSHVFTVTVQTGDVFTAQAASISGVAATKAADQSAGSFGTGTSLTSTASPATVQNNEIVFGVGSQTGNRPFTTGAGFTSIQQNGNGGTISGFLEYKVVSSTGAQTATATIDLSQAWALGVATFSDTAILPAVAGDITAGSLGVTFSKRVLTIGY